MKIRIVLSIILTLSSLSLGWLYIRTETQKDKITSIEESYISKQGLADELEGMINLDELQDTETDHIQNEPDSTTTNTTASGIPSTLNNGILFWDTDSESYKWLTIGANLFVSGSSLQAIDTDTDTDTDTNNYVTGLSITGSDTKTIALTRNGLSQLTADFTDTGFSNPMTSAGDIIFGGFNGLPTKLAGAGTDNHVLKYDTDTNTLFWSEDLQGAGSISAGSGLTLDGSTLLFGGSLTQNTLITQGAYDLVFNLSNSGVFKIQDGGTDNFVVDADGTVKMGDIAGNSYVSISNTGLLKLEGDATLEDDLRVPITSTKVGGSKDPGFAKFKDNGSGSQGVFTYVFDATNEEELYFTVQLPHSYKPGSDINAHVHWSPTTTNTGNIVWGLEYTWQNIDSTFGNTTLITGTDTADGTAYKHQLQSIGDISGTGYIESSMLVCRVYRDADNPADTYDADAALLEIDFHYQVEKFGADV